jgi:hypothetical protein
MLTPSGGAVGVGGGTVALGVAEAVGGRVASLVGLAREASVAAAKVLI